MFIITKEELEHMTEAQLHALYHSIIADLTRRNLSAAQCPLTTITLANIQTVLRRKQVRRPHALRF